MRVALSRLARWARSARPAVPSVPVAPAMLGVHRLLLAVVPALVIAGFGASVVWGDNGLLVRQGLERQLLEANDALAAIERENQRLVRDLQVMDEDPVVLERLVAEELGWGHADATLIRFPDEPEEEP